mgnify:CR=1 FL=1
MTAEENKALVRRLVEAQNQRDDATVDALIADDWMGHPWWYNPVQMDGTPTPQGRGMTRELQDAGFATRRFTGAGAPPIIYGEQRGRGPFTLLLYNHYDVQPPEPLELWESPPFEPARRPARPVGPDQHDLRGRGRPRAERAHPPGGLAPGGGVQQLPAAGAR